MVDNVSDPEWQRVMNRLKELDDETDKLLRQGNRNIMWTCAGVVLLFIALVYVSFSGGSCT